MKIKMAFGMSRSANLVMIKLHTTFVVSSFNRKFLHEVLRKYGIGPLGTLIFQSTSSSCL